MKSVMSHNFAQVPRADIQRSSFDRSSGVKTTFRSGGLYPIFVDEALPGDTFNLRTACLARLATPIYPIMDNLYMDTFYFAVPMRLVWENWERMLGSQDQPGDSTDFIIPQMPPPTGGFATDSLADHFGIPTLTEGFTVSALPFRAYQLIWDEWFRDQNLQQLFAPVPTGDGPDDPTTGGVIYPRGKRHDYFTSCLPWPQKGPDVELPLGLEAPIIRKSSLQGDFAYGGSNDTAGTVTGASGGTDGQWQAGTRGKPEGTLISLRLSNFATDLENATSATINQLRTSFQIQKMYERDARGGTRYTELIKSHFNVTSPDARLQRPEYLGGGTAPINITPVQLVRQFGRGQANRSRSGLFVTTYD